MSAAEKRLIALTDEVKSAEERAQAVSAKAAEMADAHELSPRDFLNAFLPYISNLSVEDKFKYFLREDRMYLYDQFEWLGIFDADKDFGRQLKDYQNIYVFKVEDVSFSLWRRRGKTKQAGKGSSG